MNKKIVTAVIITAVIAGGVGFYGGAVYQKSTAQSAMKGGNNFAGGQQGQGNGQRMIKV